MTGTPHDRESADHDACPTWRLPRKSRCRTTRITDPVEAVLALELTASA
ncbi:hypothetical protein ACWCRF_13525 [Streptomyces sp. NPDC002405]